MSLTYLCLNILDIPLPFPQILYQDGRNFVGKIQHQTKNIIMALFLYFKQLGHFSTIKLNLDEHLQQKKKSIAATKIKGTFKRIKLQIIQHFVGKYTKSSWARLSSTIWVNLYHPFQTSRKQINIIIHLLVYTDIYQMDIDISYNGQIIRLHQIF